MYRRAMKKTHSLIFLLFLFFTGEAIAQSREELERQREETREEIEYTKQLIDETTEKHEETLSHLQLLEQQIASREELIENYNEEIRLLENQIETNNQVVNSLEEDLENLREEYEKMIQMAHRNRLGNSMVTFILAAESFQQAFKRVQFMRHYSDQRQLQISLIESTQETLNDKVSELEEQQEEQKDLRASVNEELETLENDRQEEAELLATLEGREEELKEELEEKQERAERLNRAIEQIIQQEMEEAEERREEDEKHAVPEHEREDLQLSQNFEDNKSQLPWPVDQGFITETFGRHEHPTLDGVYVENNGIDIQTNRGERAKAIFEGEVSRIINIPGADDAVLLRHGEYFTVYSNLDEVFVEPGHEVNEGQELGSISVNSDSGETVIHFELWKNKEKQDPEIWLYDQ